MSWSAAVTEIAKFLNLIFGKLFTTPEDQVKKVVTIYDTMHEILDKTAVERILIFKAHNGGGVIKPSGALYTTALYEDYIHPFHSTKGNYSGFPVDKDYAKMLLDIMQNKKIDLVTAEMSECVLKGIYATDGVNCAKLFFLHQDRKSIYYLSAGSSKAWPIGPQTDAILGILINKIKQNIK